jgi:alkanesulfonate monooxygenase SsuD/methylene tetrahydromethanopterin reductase-like flavin-dependent oxidoreductase (luciferase family)
LADGWVSSSRIDLRTIGESIAVVRGAAEEAGRDAAAIQVVVRGLVELTDEQNGDRTPLVGSAAQIRSDLADLEAQGVDEVFVDLNFDPAIGAPGADPAASLDRAHQTLEALAPGN